MKKRITFPLSSVPKCTLATTTTTSINQAKPKLSCNDCSFCSYLLFRFLSTHTKFGCCSELFTYLLLFMMSEEKGRHSSDLSLMCMSVSGVCCAVLLLLFLSLLLLLLLLLVLLPSSSLESFHSRIFLNQSSLKCFTAPVQNVRFTVNNYKAIPKGIESFMCFSNNNINNNIIIGIIILILIFCLSCLPQLVWCVGCCRASVVAISFSCVDCSLDYCNYCTLLWNNELCSKISLSTLEWSHNNRISLTFLRTSSGHLILSEVCSSNKVYKSNAKLFDGGYFIFYNNEGCNFAVMPLILTWESLGDLTLPSPFDEENKWEVILLIFSYKKDR